jgi:tRNA(Phe) wybutosine-synthesizing methylase Tyw3
MCRIKDSMIDDDQRMHEQLDELYRELNQTEIDEDITDLETAIENGIAEIVTLIGFLAQDISNYKRLLRTQYENHRTEESGETAGVCGRDTVRKLKPTFQSDPHTTIDRREWIRRGRSQ